MSLIELGITPEDVQYILAVLSCVVPAAIAIPGGLFLLVSFLAWESNDSLHSGGSPYGPIGR